MAAGRKTGGRKKGTPNKLTTSAREGIALAAEGIGGVERLVEWAKEDPQNERIFWAQIYTRLVPVDMNHGGTVKHQHQHEQVANDANAFEGRIAGLAAREGTHSGTGQTQ